MAASNDRVKITFPLARDEPDYPPADFENVWAKVRPDGACEIDNIPFFIKNIRLGDVVSIVKNQSGKLFFSQLIQPSKHTTLRVIVFRDSPDANPLSARVGSLRQHLRNLGCATEVSHIDGLVAVDVPPESNLDEVTSFLSSGERSEFWEYEEGALPASDENAELS